MIDPLKGYMQTQALMISTANACNIAAIHYWGRGIEEMSRFWGAAPRQRRHDFGKREVCHQTGKVLTKEYGRRANDVDVERM